MLQGLDDSSMLMLDFELKLLAESAFYAVGIPSLQAELGLVTLIALRWRLALSHDASLRLCQTQAAFHHAIAAKKDAIRLCNK